MADAQNHRTASMNSTKPTSRLHRQNPSLSDAVNASVTSSEVPVLTSPRHPIARKSGEKGDTSAGQDVMECLDTTKSGNIALDLPIQEEKEPSDESSLDGDPPRQSATPVSRRPSYGSAEVHRLANHQKRPSVPTPSTPQGHRSVQFAWNASDSEFQDLPPSRSSSTNGDDGDIASKERKPSLLTKLKSFAVASPFPSHSRSASGMTMGGSPDPRNAGELQTPGSERGEFRFSSPLEAQDESEVDADAEESAGEQRSRFRKRKKKHRRPHADTDPQTAPTTPRTNSHPPLFFLSSFTPTESNLPSNFSRRSTMDVFPQRRDGVSEDEGRERLKRDTAWRRRSSALLSSARGLTQNNPDDKRPSSFRRLAAFAGSSENPEGVGTSWRRHRSDRGSSLSAQRWRQIKAGLRMIGQRRKVENTVDQVKSAELLAELTSGVPAALILASMFQRDEHGSRRIPILLEQLKLQITDSLIDSHSSDRHPVFRIELEYGSGITRMKWVVNRTLKDFANLHLKYKLHIGTQKYIQLKSPDAGHGLPRFPRSAFPYLRGVRDLDSDREDEEEDAGDETGAEAASGNERGKKMKKRRSSIGIPHRQSSLTSPIEGDGATADGTPSQTGGTNRKESYPERQRKKLETYLQKMIRFLIFRPDSNRLCKFLELSALGVRLAAEGSYHGKEGFLIIQSSKGLDFRKALTPSLITRRHSPKWFLVRHSYIVCVDSPEEMNIYDVFLVDPFFRIQTQKVRLRDQNAKEIAIAAKESATQHHTLKLENSERKLRLLARNERQLHQFEDSIDLMVQKTPWSKPNRFESFAPVRQRCFAQWLVDGRDYMWVVSRAINQAKDVIYIHDWWLSPEIYLRRPAAISQKWRLDRLLQRKAKEGVKVFVIVYRNINSAIPIDSEYSKFSLLDLHPNIFVQRSPNQIRQNTFFWAHHEKLCIIDHTLAFVGGIDLCFGRWDTPQHPVTDDKPTGFEPSNMPKDSDHCQLWPGKDYSNPRVQDFYDLDKPYEEMYDRTVVPRMPWHDISMHVVGQPARDLTRHFVQRWNYILRQRKPTRPTPFLLPPPDFNHADLEALGLDGTCEVQILRSSSMWSTGTPDLTEHSIMNAYVKLIEQSEHFVYVENQFFISSCEIDGKRIENLIGDALVERITRAAKNGQTWRAVILVPLIPGFQNAVDSEGGTSVRLIMQCQYRSICRGQTSIFGRLRARGIEPEDYIQFFSLRSWGKIGPQNQLVTEQLYIHAKCMVVDDRVAIIGSANINERSMLGSRDSECAAIVRDTDMLLSTMNGKPYLVGRFPHTLRMRLMREHLGIDVDEIMEHDIAIESELRKTREDKGTGSQDERADSESHKLERQKEREIIERRHRIQDEFLTRLDHLHSFNHDIDWEQSKNPNLKSSRKVTADPRVTENSEHRRDVDGEGADRMKGIEKAGPGIGRDTDVVCNDMEVLISDIAPEGRGVLTKPKRTKSHHPQSLVEREDAEVKLLPPTPTGMESHSEEPIASQLPPLPPSNVDYHTSPRQKPGQCPPPAPADIKQAFIDKDCMKDPVNDAFYFDTWQTVAENNTKIFRTVFRCNPDSEVKSWKEYKEYTAYGERFAELQNYPAATPHVRPVSNPHSGPPGASTIPVPTALGVSKRDSSSMEEDTAADTSGTPIGHQMVSTKDETRSSQDEKSALKALESHTSNTAQNGASNPAIQSQEKGAEKERSSSQFVGYSDTLNVNASSQQQKARRRTNTRSSKREFNASDAIIDKRHAEELLNMVQGRLVLWPYDWLEKEEQGGNWLYTLDQISPIEIYN